MKQRTGFLILLFIAWLPVFVIQKPAFMFYNSALAEGCTFTDWMQVIWHGLKLDCTIAGYLTAIPLLLTLISVWLPGLWLKKVLQYYFGLMALLIAAIFAVDEGLYSYWRFRLDATLFFYLQSPKDAMASVPLKEFVLQLLTFLAYAGGVYLFLKKCILPQVPTTMVRKRIKASLLILLLGGLMFIPIRGGVTTSTANVGVVYFSQNQFLNHSAINPTFSLMTSLSKQQDFASQFNFFPEEERARRVESLLPHKTNSVVASDDSLKLLNTDRPNILVILMESFSANVIEAVGGEAGITPNLNRLSQEGVVFSNMYANSFRTDRGIVAVLNGYLAQPTTSIMKYPAKSQMLPSIAKSLVRQGYQADMLYGGDINFTNMQSYFFSSGYSRITADRDFPISSRLNKWGANDDITFTHLFEELQQRQIADTPWLSTFLTLSSHEPFEVPFHKFDHPYLNSVAFTDSCIGNFIDKMKTTSAWKDLLVILISDHGYLYPEEIKNYEPKRYHIPMIWLGGAIKKPVVIDTLANQTDLAATLLQQLGLPHDEFTFSKDILNLHDPHYAFYTFINGFGFIDQSGVSVYNNENDQPLIQSPQDDEQRLNKGKALLQTLYDDLGSR